MQKRTKYLQITMLSVHITEILDKLMRNENNKQIKFHAMQREEEINHNALRTNYLVQYINTVDVVYRERR